MTLLIALAVAGCGDAEPPALDRLEIRAPDLEITIDRRGNGSFKQSSAGASGRFLLSSSDFVALRNRIEPFRRSPETIPESKMLDYVRHGGRCDGNYVTDNGGISFHWIGPSINQFYIVDYGCDRETHASRNAELRSVLASLPVPPPISLP